MSKRIFTALALAAAVTAAGATTNSAIAGSIENLERERAILLENFLAADMAPKERHQKVSVSKRQLVDLERIVLRDKTLVGRNTPAVRRAFANYDLTFLVHAALEKDTAILDHWLRQVGLSEQAVMGATRRRR